MQPRARAGRIFLGEVAQSEQGFQPFDGQFNLPALTVQFHNGGGVGRRLWMHAGQ